MRHLFLLAAALLIGCFKPLPFPGQQAEIDTEPVNQEDTAAVDESIFDDFLLDGFDSDGDGIDDIAISALVTFASDIPAEELCAQAQSSTTFGQLIGRFNDGRFAGTITVIIEDLANVNGASGFFNNDVIVGDNTNLFVSAFFFVNVDNQTTVAAFNADNVDAIRIDTINNDELSGNFDGLLQLDFANNPNGDTVNSVMDGQLFKADRCQMDNVIKDAIGL